MDEADFKAVYKEVFDVCRAAFDKQGFFAATAFVLQVNDKGKIGIGFPAELAEIFEKGGERGKAVAARYMNFMVEKEAVDFVVLVTEAWRAEVSEDEQDIPASEHPERTEVLMFNIMSKDCQALADCPVTRDAATNKPKVTAQTEFRFVRPDVNKSEGKFVRARRNRLN
jgi:hypothetical protein